jgi:ArsR family transcriptional regulator
MAAYFRGLGDPVRLQLIEALKAGEKTVSELVKLGSTSQSNISKHLSILAERGIVRRQKRSKFVYYSVPRSVLTALEQVHREIAGI